MTTDAALLTAEFTAATPELRLQPRLEVVDHVFAPVVRPTLAREGGGAEVAVPAILCTV